MLDRRIGLAVGTTPLLAFVAAVLVLAPAHGPGMAVSVAAVALLLAAGHLLIGIAAVPFLALGSVAQLGAWIGVALGGWSGPLPAAMMASLAGAAVLACLASTLMTSAPALVAGLTLAFAGLTSMVPAVVPTGTGATATPIIVGAVALLGLLAADIVGRSSVGLALPALRRDWHLAALPGCEPKALALVPATLAGLLAAAAGAILTLAPGSGLEQLHRDASVLSLGSAAAIWLAGERGLGAALLVGSAILVAPAAGMTLWPGLPDLRLPLIGLALAWLLLRRMWRVARRG